MDDFTRMINRCLRFVAASFRDAPNPCRIIGFALLISNVTHAAPPASEESTKRGDLVSRVIGFDRFGRHDELTDRVAGSLLIAELNCVACHASGDAHMQPRRGPDLSGAGTRLQADWIRRFLKAPHQEDPGTTMPHLLASVDESEIESTVEALAAFLQSQRKAFPEVKAGGASPVIHEFWRRGNPVDGSELYHSLGCVACHAPDPDYETGTSKPSAIDELLNQLDADEIAELGLSGEARQVPSIRHGNISEKYSLRSLTMFLLDPSLTRPGSRMPSLRLSPAEASDIAAFLMGDKTSPVSDIGSDQEHDELVELGRKRFSELRCGSCHQLSADLPSRTEKPLSELNLAAANSCLDNPGASMPHYQLDETLRTAIATRLRLGSLPALEASESVHLQMLQLNCYACHRRDSVGGVGRFRKAYFETAGNVDLGDEGRLPPPLTGVGNKLMPKALASVFHPKTTPHRPYMSIRMPTYRNDAIDSWVKTIAKADQADDTSEAEVFPTGTESLEAGRQLMDTGCVGCHVFRGESLPGVVGIDLNGITTRVRPAWFRDFVHDPGRLKKRTRMPTFFPDGKSNRPDLLDGDVDRQIASLWAYTKALPSAELPENIADARAANYELSPIEAPIVLRTFMEEAGTHAIAVGFPEGVHFAFDAENARLAIGWKGRFVDARGTWFERFAPPATPLGTPIVDLQEGPLLLGKNHQEPRFLGYRLDDDRVPVFLYRIGAVSIDDRIAVTASRTLKRTIKIRPGPESDPIRLVLHSGAQLRSSGVRSITDGQGVTVSRLNPQSQDSNVQTVAGRQVWALPLVPKKLTTVELEYRW